jgi:hypothetical protein
MKESWDSDPNKRPTTIDMSNKLVNILEVEDENPNPTEIIKSLDIGPILTNNLNKSQPLSKIIQ